MNLYEHDKHLFEIKEREKETYRNLYKIFCFLEALFAEHEY